MTFIPKIETSALSDASLSKSGQALSPQTPVNSIPTDTKKPSDSSGKTGDFDGILRALLAPDAENKVSEEALFASVAGERVTKLKGQAAGDKYKEMLALEQGQLRSADFVPLEQAAKSVLRKMRDAGDLTKEEADKIYSESFAAAQLDDNKAALWDSKGGASDPTMAVSLIEAALASAKKMVEALDSGTETAEARSVDEEAAGKGATPSLALNHSATPEATVAVGEKLDGPGGFLWKPLSTHGTLAILLPTDLAGQVEKVVIKDSAGIELDSQDKDSGAHEGREVYRYSKKGSEYGKDVTVEVKLKDGSTKTYSIPDPAKRYD